MKVVWCCSMLHLAPEALEGHFEVGRKKDSVVREALGGWRYSQAENQRHYEAHLSRRLERLKFRTVNSISISNGVHLRRHWRYSKPSSSLRSSR